MTIKYDSNTLRNLQQTNLQIPFDVNERLKQLGIYRAMAKRGKRAGRKIQRQIQVVIGNRPAENHVPWPRPATVLKSIPCSNTIQTVTQNAEPDRKTQLPNFFLTNARSLMNQYDELSVVLYPTDSPPVDVAAITDTWQTDQIADEFIDIDGFNLFTKIRSEKKGGGVAVYVKDNIPARELTEIAVPEELECIWLWVRPQRLPRSVAGMAVCAVYIPPDSEHQQTLIKHVMSLDKLKTKHADLGIVVMGDFNRTDISYLCRAHSLNQVVTVPTRKNAILDLVITNLKNQYDIPNVCSPLGKGDHNTIYWSPSGAVRTPGRVIKRTVRPLLKPDIHEFGRWITSHTWDEVLNANSTQDKTDAFYSTVHEAIERHFPTKVVKLHTSYKPWITPEIKNLIKKRQVAFAEKKMYLWRFLRNKVDRLIDCAKKFDYKDRLQKLKTCDPAGWHKGIQLITNKKKQSPLIAATGISQNDETGIAEAINKSFVSVSQSRPQLSHKDLPAFLPSRPPLLKFMFGICLYGSIKGSSTTHCLIELLDIFYKGTDKCNSIGCLVVIDFSMAFDCVDHTLAIQSLCDLGVRGEIIPWIADFLTSRRQRVRYHSATSDWQTLSCGVPQGTKFGPITFIGMINSAAVNARTHSFKYVDDMSLAEIRTTNQPSKIDMDVRDLDDWANSNYLKLNPSKCKAMQITFKRCPPSPPVLKIGGKELEVVTETKILGLSIQSNLGWDIQVNKMISKGSRRLYMLNRLKRFGLPVEDLVSVFVSYVRPVVEYATPVWHSSLTAEQFDRLENIQKRACRIILGIRYDSYTEALELTGLQRLSSRRLQLCTKFAVECSESERYSDWFPMNRSSHSMRLRRTKVYQEFRSRTKRYGDSPIPFMCRLLNNKD
ncbi:uncharacterized protein [Amphiura filiformis]|uniref:uncharacterized protein n=1 Tax=Amphiura filiformis TaxID=82378 RepID=UPI003B2175A1